MKPIGKRIESRRKLGLPLNAPLMLQDGRKLIVRSGGGDTLVARQKQPGPALEVGEKVLTKLSDGKRAVLEVARWKGKNIELKMLGVLSESEPES